jgi:hypothetical protein
LFFEEKHINRFVTIAVRGILGRHKNCDILASPITKSLPPQLLPYGNSGTYRVCVVFRRKTIKPGMRRILFKIIPGLLTLSQYKEKNHPNRRGPGRIWQKWKRGNEKVAERKEINRREE